MILGGFVSLLHTNNTVYLTFIFVLFLLIIWLLTVIFRGFVNKIVLKKFARREKVFERSEGIFIIIVFILGLDLALQRIIFENDVVFLVLRSLMVLLFTLLVIEISILMLDMWGKHMTRKKGHEFHEEVMPLTHSVVKVILFLIALLFILEFWGVEVWTLLASLGVAGVILGLALKDSLTNVFGGISLILDKTFKAGDVIQVEDSELGEVMMINLRSTRVLTYDEKIVSIPNGVLANSRITNYSQPGDLLRLFIEFGVAYGTDPEKINHIILTATKKHRKVLDKPRPEVRFVKMGEYSLDFRLDLCTRFHSIKSLEKLKDSITRMIYAVLTENKIQIPYPTRIHINMPIDKEKVDKEVKKKSGFLKGKI
ncbi:MAG: mechanosensitive ion channel family protein [Nanoarchaeota archaeon]|nr:mechanosensitive ion channel family protein [Nanoarchaeota archaeon]